MSTYILISLFAFAMSAVCRKSSRSARRGNYMIHQMIEKYTRMLFLA